MPSKSIDATRNPESMTATERRAKIASILALGVVRAARQARQAESSRHSGTSPRAEHGPEPSASSGLDLCADLPLSVAPRPAGSRAGL